MFSAAIFHDVQLKLRQIIYCSRLRGQIVLQLSSPIGKLRDNWFCLPANFESRALKDADDSRGLPDHAPHVFGRPAIYVRLLLKVFLQASCTAGFCN